MPLNEAESLQVRMLQATGKKIAVATSWLSKFERSFSVDLRPQLFAVATIVAGMLLISHYKKLILDPESAASVTSPIRHACSNPPSFMKASTSSATVDLTPNSKPPPV